MTKYLALLIIAAILPFAAVSAQITDSTITLPQLTVTAARVPTSIKDAPVRTQILDRRTLEESAALSVANLLRSRTTLHVRDYGEGLLSSLSQRGSTTSQVLVLLDGNPIVSPTTGQLDLSLLPLVLINSIEVISGASSPLYGSNAVGGIINLQTASSIPTLMFRAGMGSWGHRNASVYATGSRGEVSGMLSIDLYQSTGDYQYLYLGETAERLVSREGTDQNRQSILGSLAWKNSSSQVRLSGLYNDVERGIPTINSTTPDSAKQWDESMRVWADITQDWDWGSLQAKVQVENAKLRYANPRWQTDDMGRYTDTGSDISLRLTSIPNLDLVTGLVAGYANVRDSTLGDNSTLGDDLREYRLAAYVSGSYVWNSVRIYPSVRLDRYQKDQTISAFTPRLGINITLNSTSTLNLKGSAGRAFRMPTFNDRFFDLQGDWARGNPDLRPEKGWSFDTGLIWTSRIMQAELTVFSSHMTDQIVWQPVENEFYWAPKNVLEVTNRGLEASLTLEQRISPQLRINSNALWTYTNSQGTGEARLVPRSQIKASTDIQWRFLAFQVGARYSGIQLIDDVLELDPIFLVDTQIRFLFSPVTVRLLLDNILDNYYEFVPGNPMAPRSVRLDLSFTLR